MKIKINESNAVKSFKEELDCVMNDFLFEPNTQEVRNIIREKVRNIINDAKNQYVLEGKVFTVGKTMISAKQIGEIPVEIVMDEKDPTRVLIDTDFNGNLILNEINKQD